MHNPKCSGFVDGRIEEVRQIFCKLLSKEREGLALAAYKDDEPIVDLWGGYADKKHKKPWNEDTLTLAFSTSKVIGALAIAILVSRKHLKYEDLVTKYWPEFGQNGKETTTVEWLVGHKAGLLKFDGTLTLAQCKDTQYVAKLIEKTKPLWAPGTKTAYHVLTYSFLVDQLIRRVDPQRRGIGDFFRQEVAPLMKDKDFYIGLPRDLCPRMARIKKQRSRELLKVFLTNPAYIQIALNTVKSGYLTWKTPLQHAQYPSFLSITKFKRYNDPLVWELENISALGIGTARGLASAVSAIMMNNLISAEVWERISHPVEYINDEVIQMKNYRGYGFFYSPHPVHQNEYIMEHTGHGMQKILFVPRSKVVVALLRNGLSWDLKKDEVTNDIAKLIISQTES